jgi:chemotaxis response regulator CheB
MRIAIVNDSAMAAEALRRAVALAPENQVAWVARNGAEAVELCAKDTPDLVLMDLIMPVMDGVEATRRIMASTPCSILVVTVSIRTNAERVFEAMGHGALDAIDTPALGSGDPREGAARLLTKVEKIGKFIHDGAKFRVSEDRIEARRSSPDALVAIGASAGGPTAVSTLLGGLPASFPAAIVIIQHVDERFAAGMAKWLADTSPIPVRVAAEGDRPRPGTALLAGTGDHLAFRGADRLGYVREPADYAYRPSIDVFFQSVGRFWPGKAVGVVLTGMGTDGAQGLKALRAKGHYTIAQDQATSAVYGMPKAAAAVDAAVDILPLNRIARKLVAVCSPPLLRGRTHR